jgi:hypothetical protein
LENYCDDFIAICVTQMYLSPTENSQYLCTSGLCLRVSAGALIVLALFVISLGISWKVVNTGTAVSEKLRGIVT